MMKMCTLTHGLCDIIDVRGFVYDLCSSHPPGGNPNVLASLLKSCNVLFVHTSNGCMPHLHFLSSRPQNLPLKQHKENASCLIADAYHPTWWDLYFQTQTLDRDFLVQTGGGTDERETLTGWSRFIVRRRQDTYTHTWTDHTQRTQGIKHTCWRTLIYTVTHTLTHARTLQKAGLAGITAALSSLLLTFNLHLFILPSRRLYSVSFISFSFSSFSTIVFLPICLISLWSALSSHIYHINCWIKNYLNYL